MFEYKANKLSQHITQITDPTGVYLFLVEGETGAALIDTGVGFAGLRETVESLTSKPLTVILTHMHPDHAGGAMAFPKVYCHRADWEMAGETALESRMGYSAACMAPGTVLTEEDFLPPVTAEKKFLPLEDGYTFDLGGITLEIIHVPGHTPGSCCVLFREERSILFGDACNNNTLLMWGTDISTYRESLKRLKTFQSQFDTVYYSHGPRPEGPGTSLEDNIELCGKILAGTDDAIPCDFLGMKALRAVAITPDFRRVDGKYGNIVYTPSVVK